MQISKLKIQRIIKEVFVSKEAPTLVLMLGIHGNEISGFYAIENILQKIENQDISIKANLYVLSGNIHAIEKGKRYETVDLNRLWTDEQINRITKPNTILNADEKEQLGIYNTIKSILNKHTGIIHFVDLHTTSSPTRPFITLSDTLPNRKFSKRFPVPIVLGIESYIKGPLLTYICEYGHIGLGFEAGQHNDKVAVAINEAFIWMCLVEVGCIDSNSLADYPKQVHLLKELNDLNKQFFDIKHKHSIQPMEVFTMKPGYVNFQNIKEDEVLATSDNQKLTSAFNAKIFMPLYQSQGEDGYFVIKGISSCWLFLSNIMRKLNLYFLLHLVPGFKIIQKKGNPTVVLSEEPKVWKKYILHLFGYRESTYSNSKYYYKRRDVKIKTVA